MTRSPVCVIGTAPDRLHPLLVAHSLAAASPSTHRATTSAPRIESAEYDQRRSKEETRRAFPASTAPTVSRLARAIAPGGLLAAGHTTTGRISESVSNRIPPALTIRALPGHCLRTLSVAASNSSAANGETITSAILSARSRRLLPARIAAINAAPRFPRAREK